MRIAKTFTFIAALCLTSAATITPRESRADIKAPNLRVEKYKLENGLEVLLHKDTAAPFVTVNIWYHVGSKDEQAGKNGFAHLFEHVMFQGSKHVPEDTYFKFLERAGATSINGTTNTDRTNYFETVPKNQLDLALWLESDRMGFLLDHADDATFKSQREVVKNERRQNYENSPYGLVDQFVLERLYPEGHPYRLLTIGTPEDLDRATIEDVRAFFKDWYRPNNATLAIAGDIDEKQTKALVEKYFGPIPGKPIPARRKVPEVKLTAEKRLIVEAGVPLGQVRLTWATPKTLTEADADLDLFAKILAGGKPSRLVKRLVDELGIAQSVSAAQASQELGSNFEIEATAQKGHTAEELLAVIEQELDEIANGCSTPAAAAKTASPAKGKNLCRGKLSAGEVNLARQFYLSTFLISNERVGSRANTFNTYNQLAGDPNFLAADFARYESSTDARISKTVRENLTKTSRVVTLVHPEPSAPLAGRVAKEEKP